MKIFGKYKVSGQTEEFRKEEKNREAFCAQNKLKIHACTNFLSN